MSESCYSTAAEADINSSLTNLSLIFRTKKGTV